MTRLQFLLVNFFGWFLLIDLGGLLLWHLFTDGTFSLSISRVSATFITLLFFVALVASAVITRARLRRRYRIEPK